MAYTTYAKARLLHTIKYTYAMLVQFSAETTAKMMNIIARLSCTAEDWSNTPQMNRRVSACRYAIRSISCILAGWGDLKGHQRNLRELALPEYTGTGLPPAYHMLEDCFKADVSIYEVEDLLHDNMQDVKKR
jgi:hypothetical protein